MRHPIEMPACRDRQVPGRTRAAGLLVAGLAMCPATSGCVLAVDEEDATRDEEAIAETEQAVGATWTHWIGQQVPAHSQVEIDIGHTLERTCFLSAVNGYVGQGFRGVDFSGGDSCDFPSTCHWRLKLRNDEDFPVTMGAGAVCISNTSGRTFDHWNNQSGAESIGTHSEFPNRRCFLMNITSDSAAWWSTSDHVKLTRGVYSWFLSGSFPASSSADAVAVCVDVPQSTGAGGVMGPYSMLMVDNSSGGWACGLTKVQGFFKVHNFDGPEVTYNAAAAQWWLSGDSGKGGEARCVK